MTGHRRANGEGSIYPYRYGYAAHVWITTPAGRRQRKTVYGKTRAEVHQKWLRLHERARQGPVVPVSPKLAEFLARWLVETVEPTLAPSTTQNYEMFVRLYIVPALGERKLEKLTVRDVQTWVNDLRKQCQCCAQGKDAARDEPRCCAVGHCCHELASEWTVHQAWRVLRGALTQAMREDLVMRNVAALVKVPVPRTKRPVVWTVDQARQFLESAREANDPLYAAYVLLLVLGLRRGEVLGLAWEDVDLENQEAYIAWQLQRVGPTAQPAPDEDALLRRAAAACRTSACGRSSSAGLCRTASGSPPATPGATAGSSSPPSTATRSTPATSTATSRSGARPPGCRSSPCTRPGGPAPACSSRWTSTPASRWPSCGTARSP